MKKVNGGKAFTLTELIVSISILLILMSTVFFSFKDSPQKAENIRQMSDLGELKNSIDAYEAVYGELPHFPNASLSGSWSYWDLTEDKKDVLVDIKRFPTYGREELPYRYFLSDDGFYYKIEGKDFEGNIIKVTNKK